MWVGSVQEALHLQSVMTMVLKIACVMSYSISNVNIFAMECLLNMFPNHIAWKPIAGTVPFTDYIIIMQWMLEYMILEEIL